MSDANRHRSLDNGIRKIVACQRLCCVRNDLEWVLVLNKREPGVLLAELGYSVAGFSQVILGYGQNKTDIIGIVEALKKDNKIRSVS